MNTLAARHEQHDIMFLRNIHRNKICPPFLFEKFPIYVPHRTLRTASVRCLVSKGKHCWLMYIQSHTECVQRILGGKQGCGCLGEKHGGVQGESETVFVFTVLFTVLV